MSTACVVRPATARDLAFVTSLAKRFTDAVGFIPRAGVLEHLDRGNVTIALENGDPAGYLLGDRSREAPAVHRISQAAVAFDAQRRHHGLQLVDELVKRLLLTDRPPALLSLWCREELEANEFWRAAGFELIGRRDAGGRRGGRQILWSRELRPVTPADYLLKPIGRVRGPGGFFTKRPSIIIPEK
jgi:ribosomal protein S18 acetylase RimI-like enzyme